MCSSDLVWLGGLPSFDDAGRSLGASDRKATVVDLPATDDKALWQTLAPLVAQACGPAPVAVGTYGVEARAATVAGRRVVNLVNCTRGPLTVTLPAGRDLLSGQATGTTVELAPLVPRLIGW